MNCKIVKTDNEMINKLIKKLIQVDINKRIEWEEYFNDPFFKNESNEEEKNLDKKNKKEYNENGKLEDEGEFLNEKKNVKEKEYYSNSILNILNQTSYNPSYYQKITNFFINNFSSKTNSKIYLISHSIDRIFVVGYELPVIYNNKTINVSLLIYFPSNFPFDIEFFLEKKHNIVVNYNYQMKP